MIIDQKIFSVGSPCDYIAPFLSRVKARLPLEEWPDLVIPVKYAPQHKKYGPSLGSIVPVPYLLQRGSSGAVSKHSANEVARTTLLYAKRREANTKDSLPHLPLELWHLILKIMIARQFSINQTP